MPTNEKYPAWSDGNLLVLPRGLPIAPDRCIITNDVVPERSKISRRLSWGDEGSKWLPKKIRVLFALANMRFFTVTFGFSATARTTRLVGLTVSALCVAVGALLFAQGLHIGGVPPPMGYLGGGVALIAVSLAVFANIYLSIDIVAVDDEYLWIRGPKKAFLDSLPQLRPKKGTHQLSESMSGLEPGHGSS